MVKLNEDNQLSTNLQENHAGYRPLTGRNDVQGNIIFDEPVESFSNATIYLGVEDVSFQDIASTILSEDYIVGISLGSSDIHPLPYTIYYPGLEERKSYSLSVHVDVDGDGSLSNNDYSTWNKPVPAETGIHERDVHVELI